MLFKIIQLYLILASLAGFISMGADKKKAIRHKYRIPEKTLFLIALLGGSAGSLFGMYFFRHKTKHWYFVAGMPAILTIQVALLLFLRHLGIFNN